MSHATYNEKQKHMEERRATSLTTKMLPVHFYTIENKLRIHPLHAEITHH